MASSSSGHPPGQELVGVVPEVGEQVVGVRQDGEAVVGQEAVGLGLFMVGPTALMLVVALACLLAFWLLALLQCSVCFAVHSTLARQEDADGVQWDLRRSATQLAFSQSVSLSEPATAPKPEVVLS